jgi:hypothetical protein
MLEEKSWWNYLDKDLQELLRESEFLISEVGKWKETFRDYSFVVFPAAKAYEGFLKKILLDMHLISKEDYYGKHFRIGKSLNPTLEPKYRDEGWVYKRLSDFCHGEKLPQKLWETWRLSRNLVFHWFPREVNALTLAQAKGRYIMILSAIDAMFSACDIELENAKGK